MSRTVRLEMRFRKTQTMPWETPSQRYGDARSHLSWIERSEPLSVVRTGSSTDPRGGPWSKGVERPTTMRRAIHLLLICSILPGVVLPGQVAICLSAVIIRAPHEGCCAHKAASAVLAGRSCCAAHRPAYADKQATPRVVIGDLKPCRCCVVLSPEKHVTPRPEVQGNDQPDLLPAAHDVGAAEILLLPITVEIVAHPTSHAPPDWARSLPLLI